MKFSLFVHMERSDPKKPHKELFDELVELTLMVEKAGFETVWIGEHHMMEFTICPHSTTCRRSSTYSSARSRALSTHPST